MTLIIVVWYIHISELITSFDPRVLTLSINIYLFYQLQDSTDKICTWLMRDLCVRLCNISKQAFTN